MRYRLLCRHLGSLITTSMQFALDGNVVFHDGYGQAYFTVDSNKVPRSGRMEQAGPECNRAVHP